MPWDSNGNFIRVHNWTDDANSDIDIEASRFDAEDDNFATGINACLTKNGENSATLLNVDNIKIDGNQISSTNANGDINITPNGTGSVVIAEGDLKLGSIAVTATATELNILDGATVTTAEINELDGIRDGGSIVKSVTGSYATGSLTAGSSDTESVAHSLGTDNVAVSLMAVGSGGSASGDWEATAFRTDGASVKFLGSQAASSNQSAEVSATTGNVIIRATNKSGGTQTITVYYQITALD